MEFIIILFVILSIVSNANKKKKQAEEQAKRKAQQARQAQGPEADPRFPEGGPVPTQTRPVPRRPDPRFPDYDPTEGKQMRMDIPPPIPGHTPGEGEGSPVYETPESRAARQAQAARARREAEERARREAARQRASEKKPMAPRMDDRASKRKLESTQGRRHVLEASSISGHAHTESSMTGRPAPCPPPKAAPVVAAASPIPEHAGVNIGKMRLRFDGDSVAAGLLYGEILGKPKALRR